MNERYTFTERKTYDALPDGRIRVYYDEQESTETVTTVDRETEEETTDTYPVWSYLAVTADSLTRSSIIVALIRAEYSADDELAIQRQQDDKPIEYATYNAFVEWCKAYAGRVLLGDTLETAKAIKIAELNQFDASAAVRTFYVRQTPVWLSPNRRNNFRSYCKSLDSGQTVPFKGMTIPADTALTMLARVERYAGDTTIVTEGHAAAINALATIEAVEAYDFTEGYPDKLEF